MVMRTPRYGRKIRKKYINALKKSKSRHVCPKCGKRSLKRVGFAIFVCKSCGAVVAGGAYEPTTEAGRAALRIINSLKASKKEA